MGIGQKVQRLRLQHKWSQQELAERAGFSQAIISRLEQHTQQSVSSEHLKGLALALGVTADYLLGMYDEAEPTPTQARRKRARA